MNCSASRWIREEFSKIDLGDVRRNQRLADVANKMIKCPEYSICRSMPDWASAKGAYRLLNSDQFSCEKILEPHISRTIKRCSEFKTALIIQDTSTLSYDRRNKTEGLGSIGVKHVTGNQTRGLMMRTCFALSPLGEPLGILNQEIWARKNQRKNVTVAQKYQTQKTPIKGKESYKWIYSLYQTSFLPFKNELTFIHIADREADIYEFLRELRDLECQYIIRAAHDRNINKDKRRGFKKEKLWDHMYKQPIVEKVTIEVLGKSNQLRKATLKIATGSVELPAPPSRTVPIHGVLLNPVKVNVIWVREEHPPKGEKAVEWMLMTNLNLSVSFQSLWA